jgi:4-hydroxy-tetrahydrodipicolinate synthase
MRSLDTNPVPWRARGTIVPLVTPFSATEGLDDAALARLIEFVLDQGADAIMLTALTGEGPLLAPAETVAVWESAAGSLAGRLPIVPTVIATRTATAVELAGRAQALGAAAVMVAPIVPELYAGRSLRDVVRFHEEVADAVDVPVILFNYPSLTGVDLTATAVARLAEIPTVAYVKESTGDSRRVHAIRRAVGDEVEVICGAPNVALESLALGCRAWITGIMNMAPRSARQLMRAVDSARLELAREVYEHQLLPLVDLLGATANPTGTIKAGLAARGVDVGVPRRPGRGLEPDEARRVATVVADVAARERAVEDLLAAAA